jgi:hypothetical protein
VPPLKEGRGSLALELLALVGSGESRRQDKGKRGECRTSDRRTETQLFTDFDSPCETHLVRVPRETSYAHCRVAESLLIVALYPQSALTEADPNALGCLNHGRDGLPPTRPHL